MREGEEEEEGSSYWGYEERRGVETGTQGEGERESTVRQVEARGRVL